MTQIWWAVIGASVTAFLLKFMGHSVPEKYLNNSRALRINTLIPIALLSALVAVQSFSIKSALVVDQRVVGLGVAIIALALKAPFPVVVLGSALASAITFRVIN